MLNKQNSVVNLSRLLYIFAIHTGMYLTDGIRLAYFTR